MVSFFGISSVLDRTLFTNKGPIVKRPLPVLTGANLQVLSETTISIPTASFTSAHVGYRIEIAGSPSGRNDGEFPVAQVLGSTTVRLDGASFDVSDVTLTLDVAVALANELRGLYEAHRVQHIDENGDGTAEGVHGTDDTVNVVAAPAAFDLASLITLLNDLRSKFSAHAQDVSGNPTVHKIIDSEDVIEAPDADNLPSSLNLVNDIRRKYDAHRQKRDVHYVDDSENRVTLPPARAITGVYPGPLTGPFTWTLKDPRLGMVADDPTDVDVTVNGSPASVDAVFGMLGAVVLSTKPAPADTVLIDYDHVKNPPSRFLRLSSPEFNLNQAGNRGLTGLPQHKYRARSHLVDPGNSPDLMSPVQPKRIGWKYKGLERSYTAVLNDPTTLLLNVPTNKVSYPVLFQRIPEVTVRYDPTTLPQNATDPWVLDGDGTFSLAPGGNQLAIVDQDVQTGPDSMPPFFHHEVDLRAPSLVSAAFRALVVDDNDLVYDGVFTGVAFGVSDGGKAAVVGFILTEATNLSSAIVLANSLKAAFNAHIVNLGSHSPDDTGDATTVVDATDLESLLILANEVRSQYLIHIAKGGGPGLVHQVADGANVVSSPAANDLTEALALLNEMMGAFNSHIGYPGVHFVDDTVNEVPLVKQVGILTDADFPEFADSWQSFAQDWTEFVTYRLSYGSGVADLYRSGDTDPGAEVDRASLPALSDLDGKFDPAQQVFFGAIGRESQSTSLWQFIRVNIAPLDGNLIEDNKAVDYDGSVLPELDPSAPWITIGQEGQERILSPDILLLDSTASTPEADVAAYGMTSGNFRGFTRLEPIMGGTTAAAVEFRFSGDWYTHGLDNSSMCVVLDDRDFSVQLAFLQYSPSAATVTGTASEPFLIVAGDELLLRVEGGPVLTVSFLLGDTTAALVATRINAVAGYVMADVVSGHVRLTSPNLGATSSFEVVSGSALSKLGLSPGPYFGLDSNPEPRVSWFGGNLPDLDDTPWVRGGSQASSMLGRTMRITDTEIGDFLAFTQDNLLVTNQAFNSVVDWKLDFRTQVLSFQPGTTTTTVAPYSDLYFAGALVAVDEGPTGKNVEVHLVVDGSGSQFLNLLSYNPSTDELDVMSQYAFAWGDGGVHSFSVYTSKAANMVMVLADGQVLSPFVGPSPTYTGLNQGVAGPAVSFGSGSEPVSNSDPKSSKSVVDWQSVAVFRDSKVGDPTAGSRRYVGVYQGGDPSVLSSYALHQIDWSVAHTYRLVRNPVTSVSVYVDGAAVPSISVAYDVLALPPASSSFLDGVTGPHSAVSFGAFNPGEISRGRWDFVRYSIGKISLTDRIVPPHQVLNQHNAVASPDHLYTQEPHAHAGFTVYSGGTPLDDFMSNEDVASYTNLGEGTAPIPMTQDLESRGGMDKIATPADGVPAVDFVNTKGYMTDLEDDSTNALEEPIASDLATAIALANDVRAKYLAHLVQYRVHLADDTENDVLPDVATDLATAIDLANSEKEVFNVHLTATIREVQKVHSEDDLANAVVSPDATDLASLVILLNDIRARYEAHRVEAGVHGSTLFIRLAPPSRVLYEGMKFYRVETGTEGLVAPFSDDETMYVDGFRLQGGASFSYDASVLPEDQELQDVITLSNDFRARYEAHRVEAGVHATDDTVNVVSAAVATDLPTALTLLQDLKAVFDAHLVEAGVHVADDPRNTALGADPTVLKMAQALANELKLKFERHRVSLVAHLVADDVNAVTAPDVAPVANPGWIRYDAGPGTPDLSLQTVGPLDVLRYGTTVSGPVETAYRRRTGIPDDPSIGVEMTISMRINAYPAGSDVDTGIYAGMLSKAGPGVAVAVGFDVMGDIPYVKLQDVNANEAVFRAPFNWGDGSFHTYKIVRDPVTGNYGLVVVS